MSRMEALRSEDQATLDRPDSCEGGAEEEGCYSAHEAGVREVVIGGEGGVRGCLGRREMGEARRGAAE